MSAIAPTSAPRNVWERADPVVDAGQLILLLVLAAAVVPDLAPASRVALAVAASVAIAWHVAWRGRVRCSDGYPRPHLVFFAGLIVCWVALIVIHPAMLFLAFAVFWTTWSRFELRESLPLAFVVTAVLVGMQVRIGGDARVALVNGAISLLFGAGLAWFITAIITQSAARAELIAQLEHTRDELAAAEREAGMRAERERLAAEIHDTLAQGFTSIVMLTQAADGALQRGDVDAVGRHLTSAQRTARDNLSEARRLVADLAPPGLDGATLAAALERLAEQMTEDTRVVTTFSVTGVPRPTSAAVEVVLLRAAQELTANVAKHASATRCEVNLRFGDDGTTVLRVVDDGCGFDAGSSVRGFGLRGVRTRVGEAGGDVVVSSATGTGTSVEVSVP